MKFKEVKMLLKRIENTADALFLKAFDLCEASFPYEERRDLDELLRVMKNSDYHFCVLLEGEELCGIVLYWEADSFIYLEHLATDPQKRNHGFGSKALELLGQKGKVIILEIEPPLDELTRRRLGFYQRNGYTAVPYRHIQAKYHEGDPDVVLTILSAPYAIDQKTYGEFNRYLQRYVGFGANRNF